MLSTFPHLSALHHDDPIRHTADAHPVGYDNGGFVLYHFHELGQYIIFHQGIQGTGGLVEDNDVAFLPHAPRYGQFLPLAA